MPDLSQPRARVEALMAENGDLVDIHEAGADVYDPDAGRHVPTKGPLLWSGRVLRSTGGGSETTHGEGIAARYDDTAMMPLDAPEIPEGAMLTLVEVAEGGDESMVGHEWRIDAVDAPSMAVARNLGLVKIRPTTEDYLQ